MEPKRKCAKCGAGQLVLTRKKVGGAMGTKKTYSCAECGVSVTTQGTWGNVAFWLFFTVGVAILTFVVQNHTLTSAPIPAYGVMGFFVVMAGWQAFSKLTFDKSHPLA